MDVNVALALGVGYWAEAHEKIPSITLTIKDERNLSSFQLANRAPPLSVTDSSIAPSARMLARARFVQDQAHELKDVTHRSRAK